MNKFLVFLTFSAVLFAEEKMNVLMIAVDDLKPMLGFYGYNQIKSPNFDKLASQSTVFFNAHCQQSVCGASRASIMTGLRPDNTRVWEFRQKMRERNPDVITIPQHFKSQGYITSFTGKIFDYRCVIDGKNQDMTSWSRREQARSCLAMKNFGFANPLFHEMLRLKKIDLKKRGGSDQYDELKKAIGKLPSFEADMDVSDESYEDGLIAKEGMRLIKEMGQKQKSFFIAIGFKKPHLPFVAPKKYWDLYDLNDFKLENYQQASQGAPKYAYQDSWELSAYDVPRLNGQIPDEFQFKLKHGYAACVSYIDAQLGKVLRTLEEEGLKDKTIICFWGDHGFHLGDHGMWCKHSNYEQATRVPFLIFDPRQKLKKGKINSPVELIDLFPTLCDLSEIPMPDKLDGKSLLLDDRQSFALSQFPRNLSKSKKMMGYSFRFDRYRYVEWVNNNYQIDNKASGPLVAVELYDYDKDPEERINLANNPEYQGVLKALQDEARKSGLSRAIYN